MTMQFTLLLFGWDDSVLSVQPISANDIAWARQVAESAANPRVAGWQLWHAGKKVLATFPQNERRGGRGLTLMLGGRSG